MHIDDETIHLVKLKVAYDNASRLLTDCNCPKRCKVTDYHIFVDQSSACQGQDTFKFSNDGRALIIIAFPSKRVRSESSHTRI